MDDEATGSAEQLFGGIVFAILPSDKLSSADAETLSGHMIDAGGQPIPLKSDDGSIDRLDEITHIISTDIDFPQYNAALEHGINIVKPSWVTQSIYKGKTAQPRQHSPDPSQYFNEVIMTTAGLPESDKDALIAGLIALGGQYSSALSKLVTHLVTLDPTNDEKCRVVQEKGLKTKIVLPHWFDDCFRLGKKISEAPYMFPDPEILKRDHTTKVRDNPSPFIAGAITAIPGGATATPPSSPSAARKRLNAFVGKKIMLSDDLRLPSRTLETLGDLISHSGGEVTRDVSEADIYVGLYRDGNAYVSASRAGKEVGNLSWLYHVLNRNQYTSPLSKLLHYPVPRHGVPGFDSLKISVSNYQGDARIYLENLIRHCGGQYTRTMREHDNSHLITAHLQSAKVDAAQSWGLNIVNHIWLEECYAKCAVQPLTNPRYVTFPARTNLGEVTGQTRLDMARIERMYFPQWRESPKKAAQPASAVANVPAPLLAEAFAGASKGRQFTPAINVEPEAEAEEDVEEEPKTAKKPRGRPSKTAMTPRLQDDEKENESPFLTQSGRASKAKAMGLLHKQADDIALYNKEMKRKGGITHGGRRSENAELMSSPAPMPKPRPKKRTSDEISYDVTAEGSDLSDGETQPNKPAKKAKNAPASTALPPVKYHMMVTGDERWVANGPKESQDRLKLRQLGVQLTQDPANVDILVAPKILRTRKFVAALAAAPIVVDSKYLDTALQQGKLSENPPTLKDSATEERLGLNLAESLQRAKVNNRKLLRGWTIYVTKDIPGSFDTFKEIVTLNGGSALLYQGRTGLTSLPKRRLREDPAAGSESQNQGSDEEFDFVYLVSGSSAAEEKLWKVFREVAAKQDLAARVVSSDWLLNAAMRQEVIWDEKWLLDGKRPGGKN